jgi:hypothetical protein
MRNDMQTAFAKAFEEWDVRYRRDPSQFMSEVEHLLGTSPDSYGEACAVYFVAILDALSGGQPWATIAKEQTGTTTSFGPGDYAKSIEAGRAFDNAMAKVQETANPEPFKFDDIVKGYAETAVRSLGEMTGELGPSFSIVIRSACEDVLKRYKASHPPGRPAGVP